MNELMFRPLSDDSGHAILGKILISYPVVLLSAALSVLLVSPLIFLAGFLPNLPGHLVVYALPGIPLLYWVTLMASRFCHKVIERWTHAMWGRPKDPALANHWGERALVTFWVSILGLGLLFVLELIAMAPSMLYMTTLDQAQNNQFLEGALIPAFVVAATMTISASRSFMASVYGHWQAGR